MHKAGLESILERAEADGTLSESEIVFLLGMSEKEGIEALFAAARRVRDKHWGRKVFLYGFVYLSTYCRNNCHFCFYRASNTQSIRYRKSHEQIVEAAKQLAESNVHLIDLTMGEDPAYFDKDGFKELATVVASVAEATDLPVMISPGLVDESVLSLLKHSGASWYACYQETYNRSLFEKLRPGQDFQRRLDAKRTARRIGLLTEEGMLSGVGESSADVARTILSMGELEADQVRVMSFVPQMGTPLSNRPAANPDAELKIIAIMRLLYADRLVPASLDVMGLQGLKERLHSGANVITSLVPPGEGFAGVAQSCLDIDDARRTVASIEPVLRECGLAAGTKSEYRQWVEGRLDKADYGIVGDGTAERLDRC